MNMNVFLYEKKKIKAATKQFSFILIVFNVKSSFRTQYFVMSSIYFLAE